MYNINIRISENQKKRCFYVSGNQKSLANNNTVRNYKKLGISEGDKFEIVEKDGGIFLCPVVVYPKEKITKIAKLLKESESKTKNQSAFESVEDMFADMGIDIDNV